MMMCTMKYGVFIFFGAWQTIALVFVIFFLPETRGVPIERVRLPAHALCCHIYVACVFVPL